MRVDSIPFRPVSIILMTNNIRVFLWLALALGVWVNYTQWQHDYAPKPVIAACSPEKMDHSPTNKANPRR